MNKPLPKLPFNLSTIDADQSVIWGEERIVCLECEGTGFFYLDNGPSGATLDCDDCGGNGGWPANATRFDDPKNGEM